MSSIPSAVELFAGNFAQQNYMACQGQPLPIAQYTGLFSMIGTEYGGDGRIHFNLPKLAPITEDGGTEPLSYYMNVSSGGLGPTWRSDMGIGAFGEIGLIGATFAPRDWMECEGQSLSVSSYSDLFDVIGYTFGGSNELFNLPNIPKLQAEGSIGKVSYVIRVANGAYTGTGTTGVITRWAGQQLPQGSQFMSCDGSELEISNFPALFSILGTIYGGDGKTTFGIPKLSTGDETKYIICVKGQYPVRN